MLGGSANKFNEASLEIKLMVLVINSFKHKLLPHCYD